MTVGAAPRKAFTLLELMVIIAILAIVALIAMPSFSHWIGNSEAKAEAQAVANTMRQARSIAARSQKPIRVVLNCAGGQTGQKTLCGIKIEEPSFDSSGALRKWQRRSGGAQELRPGVLASPIKADQAPVDPATKWLFQGLGNEAGDNLTVVFLPTGEAVTAFVPFEVLFTPTHNNAGRNGAAWRLRLFNMTGHLKLSRNTNEQGGQR